MKRFLSLAVVLGLAFTVGAADEKKKKKGQAADLTAVFAKLDANSDKKVTKEEFDTFKGLATPKAGKEGKEPKGIAEARGEWFKKLDANTDNSISADEFAKIKDAIAARPAKKRKAK